MKRKHPPPPVVGLEELFDFILSPPKSKNNQKLDETIDLLLSQPSPPPGGSTISEPPQNPTDETVQDLLDWLGSLWLPEPNQESPCGALTVPRPFPWVADYLGMKIHSLEYIHYTLLIDTVSADFECNICGDVEKIEYNIVEKYMQISRYIDKKGPTMGGVAPTSWLFPTRPQCKKCKNKRRSLGQVIKKDGSSINWLFLLMGKLIGCCKVHQLREFCERNGIESSGKKPRLVYLTYLGLCRQLDPRGNYDI